MVKYMINRVIGVLVVVLALCSCDSRQDLFLDEVNRQEIVVELDGVRDTTFGYTVSHVVNLERNMYPRSITNSSYINYDTVMMRAYGLLNGKEYPLEIVGRQDLPEFDHLLGSLIRSEYSGVMNFRIRKAEDDLYGIVLTNRSDVDELNFFNNDTASSCLGHYVVNINFLDIYGRDGMQSDGEVNGFALDLVYWGPCPPIPVLDVEDCGGDPMEKRLSLARSYDKDGVVVKYEYCIDGNVIPYKATDNRFDFLRGDWQAGKAAYGGTYITATALNEVNFVFQTEGLHTIYYRCMDDMYVWSTWRSETINVKR